MDKSKPQLAEPSEERMPSLGRKFIFNFSCLERQFNGWVSRAAVSACMWRSYSLILWIRTYEWGIISKMIVFCVPTWPMDITVADTRCDISPNSKSVGSHPNPFNKRCDLWIPLVNRRTRYLKVSLRPASVSVWSSADSPPSWMTAALLHPMLHGLAAIAMAPLTRSGAPSSGLATYFRCRTNHGTHMLYTPLSSVQRRSSDQIPPRSWHTSWPSPCIRTSTWHMDIVATSTPMMNTSCHRQRHRCFWLVQLEAPFCGCLCQGFLCFQDDSFEDVLFDSWRHFWTSLLTGVIGYVR